ncbi:MAG: hypothetical protein NWT08_06120 [Akkermansiaceae bacterium]|nr:hypothetical protein [Akkermansiaceae bacterium]
MLPKLKRLIAPAFLATFSCTIIAGAALLFIPKKYECAMEIRSREIPPELLKRPTGLITCGIEMPDGWLYRTRHSLTLVSKRLNLPQRWKMTEFEVLYFLKTNIDVEPKGERTYLIKVHHNDPQESLDIANALLAANQETFRKIWSDSFNPNFTDKMKRDIFEQEKKVAERKKVVVTIAQDPDSPQSQRDLIDAKLDLELDQATLEAMGEMLENRINNAQSREEQAENPIELLKAPALPDEYISPRRELVLLGGAVTGLLVGIGIWMRR